MGEPRILEGGLNTGRAADVIKLAVGQTATVKLAGSTTTIEGKIRLIAPTVDPQTRNGLVYVDLPATGTRVEQGQPFGEVESTKSVSDIYAPVTGTVVARNEALDGSPELVNSDPYGEGWMFEIRPDDPGAADALLSAADYRAQLG